MTPNRYTLGYMPSLDGMRGIAVLLVIIFHGRTGIIPGGYFGVDIFFVLSGFLITSILLREYSKTGNINLANFYLRRVLRIVPALALMMMAYASVALLIRMDLRIPFGDIIASGLFISNWTQAFDLGFTNYLDHTWSLSVEEQFYLLWPATLIFLLRRLALRDVLVTVLASVLLIMVWRILLFLDGASLERIYRGFDTRVDALLLGAGLACFLALPDSRARFRLSSEALNFIKASTLLLVCILVWSNRLDPAMILGGYSFVAVFTAAVILVLSQDQATFFRRCLEWRPLVVVGKLSYGLYLWHFMIFKIMRLEFYASIPTVNTVGVALTFAAAVASYLLLERPLLNLKAQFASA